MDGKSISYSTDSGDSWLFNIVNIVDKSNSAFKKFDCLPENPSAFDSLDPLKKLRVLNILCDEALQTEKLRNWMNNENQKYIEHKKEMKKTKSEAKKKGVDMKKTMKGDGAQMMQTVEDEVLLSVTEHFNLISELKEASGQAKAKILETMGTLPKNKQRRDAMRTDPVHCEKEGRLYWELEGYTNDSKILLQDVGNMASTILQDRWLSYNPEEEKIIEKYISSTRNKQRWASKIAEDMDDAHVQGRESDNVGEDHHAKGSESVNIASDGHVRACKSGNAADDKHATCSEPANVADDDHATCLEPVNVAGGDRATYCEFANIPVDDLATCSEPVIVAVDDYVICCKPIDVACDNQAMDCEPDKVAMPSIPIQ